MTILNPDSGSTQISRIKRCFASAFDLKWARHQQWQTSHTETMDQDGEHCLLSASCKQKDRDNFAVMILNARQKVIGAGYPGFDQQLLFVNQRGELHAYQISDPYQQDVTFIPLAGNAGELLDQVLSEIDPSQKILKKLFLGQAQELAAD